MQCATMHWKYSQIDVPNKNGVRWSKDMKISMLEHLTTREVGIDRMLCDSVSKTMDVSLKNKH